MIPTEYWFIKAVVKLTWTHFRNAEVSEIVWI